MAINAGAGPHSCFITVGGGTYPIVHGSVEQQAKRKASTFSCVVPLSFPGAEAAFATLGDNGASIQVNSNAGSATLIAGEVDDVSFDYIARTIHVSGRDGSGKLHENMSSEKWQNKKGSDIVQDLAGRVGLSVSAETSQLLAGKLLTQDYVRLSDNISFSYIIHKLAELDGARWWVDNNNQLHYAIANSPQGTYTLNYTPPSPDVVADFLRLIITRNVQAGKTIQVTVNSWHAKDKKAYSNTATIGGSGGPRVYHYVLPNLKEDHVKQHAKSKANEVARHEIRLRATCVGDPSINVAMGLQLNGTGFWDQMYEMDTIVHVFGMGGYTMSITARAGKGGRSAS